MPARFNSLNLLDSFLVVFQEPVGLLARMLHEGNEAQGKYGKQGWFIARRCIAIAMGEPDKGKDPADLFPGERVAHG